MKNVFHIDSKGDISFARIMAVILSICLLIFLLGACHPFSKMTLTGANASAEISQEDESAQSSSSDDEAESSSIPSSSETTKDTPESTQDAQTEVSEETTVETIESTTESTTAPTTTRATTTTAATTTSPPPTEVQGSYNNHHAQTIVTMVNGERDAEGLNALTVNSNLEAAARIRAKEIVILFDHDRPDGTDWYTVVQGSFSGLGENLAMGQNSPHFAMSEWMGSPGHRSNILNPNHQYIGVACFESNGTLYWVQIFGW